MPRKTDASSPLFVAYFVAGRRSSLQPNEETESRPTSYALPINTPEAKTRAPPRMTWRALIQKLIAKYL